MIAAAGALLVCTPLLAQAERPRYELGVRAGVGNYEAYEDSSPSRAVIGVEGCAFCSGRFGLFGSYSHLFAPGSGGYRSAELLQTGLRIQGRGRVSAFFDAGLAAGYSRHTWGAGSSKGTGAVGGCLGTGVAFRTAKGLYIRPQARLSIMSDLYFAASAEVAVGWRF